MDMKGAAVIDIGSNSVRMAYNEGEAPLLKRLVSTGLGTGLTLTGRLDDSRMLLTLEAAASFAAGAALKKRRIFCFATEAVRSAANRERFLALAKREYGLDIEVLGGKQEALCSYLGASAGRQDCEVVDVGGASTEIIAGRGDTVVSAVSLPLGAVSLAGAFKDDTAALTRHALRILEPAASLPKSGRLLAVGGTATSLAAVYRGGYDPRRNHLTTLTEDWLKQTARQMAASRDIGADFPSLPAKRRFIIKQGLALLLAVMKTCGYPEITVSESDNIEGYILYKEKFSG